EQVWQAITDPAKTSKFWFNCAIQSSWEIGSSFELLGPEGEKKVKGVILELDRPYKLAVSWQFVDLPGTENDAPSRVTWEIAQHAEIP
ncbi:SRPBCC domain-containing protein, partial [Bacillus pumilus]